MNTVEVFGLGDFGDFMKLVMLLISINNFEFNFNLNFRIFDKEYYSYTKQIICIPNYTGINEIIDNS